MTSLSRWTKQTCPLLYTETLPTSPETLFSGCPWKDRSECGRPEHPLGGVEIPQRQSHSSTHAPHLCVVLAAGPFAREHVTLEAVLGEFDWQNGNQISSSAHPASGSSSSHWDSGQDALPFRTEHRVWAQPLSQP